MPRTDFFGLLDSSMGLLRAAAPASYHRLGIVLDGLTARLHTDDGARQITFVDGVFEQYSPRSNDVDVEVSFSGCAVLDLIDGRSTLEELILEESLRVRGKPQMVERYHEALTVFVGGAIRLPGFLPLLEAYRSHLGETGIRDKREAG